jgi:hypothetical protein
MLFGGLIQRPRAIVKAAYDWLGYRLELKARNSERLVESLINRVEISG